MYVLLMIVYFGCWYIGTTCHNVSGKKSIRILYCLAPLFYIYLYGELMICQNSWTNYINTAVVIFNPIKIMSGLVEY